MNADFDLVRLIEAVLFAAQAPMDARDLAARLPEGADVAGLLDEVRRQYAPRGVNLVERDGKWAFRTAADLAGRLHVETTEVRRLSRAAVEVLAIVAYHQPVTRAEIEDIRGVALSKGTLDALFDAGWIRPKGRRRTPGRPLQWATTEGFLDHFGLESLDDLPDAKELKASGLLDARPAADAYGNRAVDAGTPVDTGEAEDEDDERELRGELRGQELRGHNT
ncbi:MAG: SMC-Scp complex subunit ScpB [Magnetospirillum sp.]|nr:SMC-Scp complex subunit ScpB [Magnetospirillum sp.]